VTRTVHFGNPTEFEKDMYTRVLLGNLNILRLKWKDRNMSGMDIDMLARSLLAFVGISFPHSTGHGVGHYSGVHEFPPQIDRYFTNPYVPG
jgi:Xaa-Pro aminopeptidase